MKTLAAFKALVMEQGAAFLRRRALHWTLGVFAALVLLFGALGYFWLPGFAKAKLETVLSEQLARPVRIERIDISPYALSVTVRGFAIGERTDNGTEQEFLGFDSLFVNLSSATLFRLVPVVSEVRLVGPRIRVVRLADGRYNFSDILDKLAAAAEKPEKTTGTPQFSVANISLSGGSVAFEDQVAESAQAVTEISLGVPFIANTPGTVESYVQPSFSAKVDGAPLALGGKARPFAPGQDAALEISITDFDLMRLARYLPPGLPARLQSARLDAALVVNFARPKGQDAQVRVSGKAALRDVVLAGTAKDGAAKGGGAKDGAVLRLKKAELTLDEATLGGAARGTLALAGFSVARGGAEPLLGFASLEVKGLDLTLAGRKAVVGEVLLSSPFATVRRLADGSLDAQKLAADFSAPVAPTTRTTAPKPTAKEPVAKQEAPGKDKGTAWTWNVDRVAVQGGSLRFADDSLGKRARQFSALELALKLEGLSSAPGAGATKLDFSTRVNEQGSVAVRGGFRLAPLSADLDLSLSRVDLVALQGWATQNLNAVLTRGEISAQGHFRLAGEDASFAGDAALIDLSVLDKLNSADLVRWRNLRLTGLDAGSAPPRFGAKEIALSSFYATVLLTPEGHLNLQEVVKREDAHGAQPTNDNASQANPAAGNAPVGVALTAKPAPALAQKSGPEPQIRIGRVSLSGGNIVFNDHFIKPNYTANLTDLAGSVGPVRSGAQTDVAIRGKVDRTAPLDITGTMAPLDKPLSLDIRAKATGIEMSNFSPYSGRYVGYAIEKGKLSVDVRYRVDKGTLKAENQVFLDQLTVGKKVDSPGAMNIPLNLVVALLSNSRGEIDINLPIEGSLDDPQFSLGGIIVKVIVNLLVKAATSPFKLLASLFGGGEELSYLAFEPGRAEVSAESEKALQTLAKALRDRPGLKLELAGHADPQVEIEGFKRAALDHRVRAQKATELARRGKASGSVDELTVTVEEYPTYLARVYKAADFKKPRNLIGMAKGLPVEEMEALLLQNIEVRQEDMERLAQDRGIAAQAWLVEKGGLEQARVFLLGPRVDGETPKGVKAGGRVDFSLK